MRVGLGKCSGEGGLGLAFAIVELVGPSMIAKGECVAVICQF